MATLRAQLQLFDPHELLIAQLEQLDAIYARAASRERCSGQYNYSDPDGQTMLKALAEGRKLVAAYHEARASSLGDIEAQTRTEAIAELEAVLAAWREVSDETWLAARRAPAQVSRRKRAAP